MIVTAGTIVGKWEERYVLDAVCNLSSPKRFDYYIKTFEEEFAKYIGVKYALAVATGTAALHLALLSLGIGEGDEVIVPNLAFIAAANAVRYCGAEVITVDVEKDSWCIDVEEVKKAITKRTKVILPVYMFGNKPDMTNLKKLGIPIVEDTCPAIGTKGAGTYGIGCFSFQGAKTLAIGEGGMLTTNNKKIYEKAKMLANHAKIDANFTTDGIGYNYRLSNIQAALGLGQLKHIDQLIEKKKKIHEWYGDYCQQVFTEDSVCWMNTILSINRKRLRQYLFKKGIDTRNVYPTIYHQYLEEGDNADFSTIVAECGVNLPSATYLTKGDISYVKSCIKAYYKD